MNANANTVVGSANRPDRSAARDEMLRNEADQLRVDAELAIWEVSLAISLRIAKGERFPFHF